MFFVRDDFYCNLTHENAMPGSRRLPDIALNRSAAREAAAQNRVQQPPFMKILHKRQKNLLLELLMYQICAILLDVSP